MRPRNKDAAETKLRKPTPQRRRRRIRSLTWMYIGRWMPGKWAVLIAAIWIQAVTGTNFDFSAYSSELKSVLRISQVELNYLAVASDLGKAVGWTSGFALIYFPLPAVLFAAALMGLVGYGVQWLVIADVISLPYFLVFLCCLFAGLSICWFNTICFILCIRNFPSNRSLALSLTISFNGISAALYTVAYNAIEPSSPNVYLLLNALVPLFVSIAAVIPILSKPYLDPILPDHEIRQHDSLIFLLLNFIAIVTSIYLLFFGSSTDFGSSARLHLIGTFLFLIFPLCVPGLVYAANDLGHVINSHFNLEGSGYVIVNVDEREVHKAGHDDKVGNILTSGTTSQKKDTEEVDKLMMKDRLVMIGDEHSVGSLLRSLDFWLYYIAYFCGGTIGLVYSNNLGQIAQSLGQSSNTTSLVTLYSSFSFFGRLLSAAPDYMRMKVPFARTGWLTVALIPTPIAFILLSSSYEPSTLQAATALLGISSGFIFAIAVSITSDLFGPKSMGVNHNILVTNIPIGSLLYGFLAALVYEANAEPEIRSLVSDSVVCMGSRCYFLTFVWWGSLSIIGLVSSLLLFLRTERAYVRLEQERVSTTLR